MIPQTLILLKKSKKEELVNKLSLYYGDNLEKLKSYNFYMNEKTRKIHMCKLDINIDIRRITNVGIYFGTYHDNERFRLSIEGSQFIKPTKNFLILKEENLKSYLAAESLFTEEIEKFNWQENTPFLIAIYDGENLGCVNIKGKEILNYVPKSRKLNFDKLF
ncbi:MAG: hypothetical protein PF569_04460 [Candidatus Woesearchaeota archaeon]|jgi:NOL1/NOP2/fmu family ribosome biogenesis protein|nr:hypothetical protein [Candidatus Woesearchaeota archaeon]